MLLKASLVHAQRMRLTLSLLGAFTWENVLTISLSSYKGVKFYNRKANRVDPDEIIPISHLIMIHTVCKGIHCSPLV